MMTPVKYYKILKLLGFIFAQYTFTIALCVMNEDSHLDVILHIIWVCVIGVISTLIE